MNRNFLLLFQGQLVSQLGTQIFSVALIFWVKHETGSASLLGLMMMASGLPAVILGLVGGTFADRISRRRILIASDVVSGLVILVLWAMLTWLPGRTHLTLGWVFIAAVAVAAAGAFFRPAITAAIPDLVPEDRVAAANSLIQGSLQVAVFIGQGLGGVLYRLLGAALVSLLNGVSYLVSALSEAFIHIPQRLEKRAGGWRDLAVQVKQEMLEGWQHVRGRTGLRGVFILIGFMNFFLMPIILLLPFYVEGVLGAEPDWYGFLIAAFGAGGLGGNLAAGTLRLAGPMRARVTGGAMMAFAGVTTVLGLVHAPPVALVLMTLGGVLTGYVNINFTTAIQVTTPSEIRGRVFGLLGTLTGGLSPIAMGVAGVVADLTGHNIPAIYVTCGAVVAVLTAGIWARPAIRDFLAY